MPMWAYYIPRWLLALIAANDRPFTGDMSIPPDAYQLLIDTLRDMPK